MLIYSKEADSHMPRDPPSFPLTFLLTALLPLLLKQIPMYIDLKGAKSLKQISQKMERKGEEESM